MNLKSLILVTSYLVSSFVFSQNMDEGFAYLESGNYSKAENYFENILIEFPENKTAKLCYARAVGLQGEAKKALSIFVELLNKYPLDFEIKLNYAEALLWNKKYSEAKLFYKTLIEENDQSFPAILGYANTLSNLKIYDQALVYIEKALQLSPENPNALNSMKFIYLGYAYQKQQLQSYDEAEQLLLKNLKLFKDDKDTLLNLANLYLMSDQLENAKTTYGILSEQPDNQPLALNGLALVAHLEGKEKKALALSTQAFNSITPNTDKTTVKQTTERYIQALIWNKKYKAAKSLIYGLIQEQPNENWILALGATLNIYKSDFKNSLADYNKILENDSTSFDGNLGKANALKALGYFDDAYTSAENTLKFYPNQKDASNFIRNLNSSFSPFIDAKGSYTYDNGDNEAFSFANSVEFPLSTKLKLMGNYGYRSTNNKVSNNKAVSNEFSMGMSYQLLPNGILKGTAGIISAKAETVDYSQLLINLSLNIKPLKLQTLELGYKREIQNFNADLLDRELVLSNFYVNYNISTNFNLGWFIQYYYTSQNDDNIRNLLFTSLYYNILSKPNLKAGFNYQNITFKNQVPTIYFSPEKFNAGEVFINLIKDEVISKSKEWFYELTAATGLQYIEDNSSQSTYRIQGKMGYKLSERFLVNAFGVRSNIASATAAGFTFTEIGVGFKWLVSSKPIFSIKKGKD